MYKEREDGPAYQTPWQAFTSLSAKDAEKCDGNCDCPNCTAKKKPAEEKGPEK